MDFDVYGSDISSRFILQEIRKWNTAFWFRYKGAYVSDFTIIVEAPLFLMTNVKVPLLLRKFSTSQEEMIHCGVKKGAMWTRNSFILLLKFRKPTKGDSGDDGVLIIDI